MLTNSTTIKPAAGVAMPTIDGQGLGTVFDAQAPSVTFSGIEIEDGLGLGAPDLATQTGSGSTPCSGAIGVGNGSTVTVANSVFDDNSGTYGGAIGDDDCYDVTAGLSEALNVTDSLFENNSATSYGASGNRYYGGGGAIAMAGGAAVDNMRVTNTTFLDNSAAGDGGAVSYGYLEGAGPGVISGSTFTGNVSENGNGGAINNSAVDGNTTLEVKESTFYDNSALGSNYGNGGAIYADGSNLEQSSVTVLSSTLSDNTSANAGSALYNAPDGDLNVAGTILSDPASGTNCASGAQPIDDLFNLDSDGSCGFPSPHDIVGVDADLGSLQQNGGPTETMEPSMSSPVVDQIPPMTEVTTGAGQYKLCSAADQRGQTPLQSVFGCAIGSVNVQNNSLPIVTSITPTTGPSAGGTTLTVTGVNLGGVTAVNFGGTAAASFNSVSSTSLTAVSAGGTGFALIEVTTPDGTSPYRSGAVYIYKATNAITWTSPPPSSDDAGSNALLGATATSGAPVTFTAYPATVCSMDAPGSDQVDFTAAGRCTVAAHSAATIFYYAPPVAEATIAVEA
ncbi:MAG: IPT/TIG domain-containing protein [Acidimicrobiales bacterium]